MNIEINKLRRDGGTQPRAAVDFDVAYGYGDEMKAGARFPPVVVFYDGESHWLADGFHRVEGAESIGLTEIACDLRQGTCADAQWYSFGANSTHGLRRSNEDKQRAVKAALLHPLGAGKSNRAIGKHVGVDDTTVSDWRRSLESTAGIPQSSVRTGCDGRSINTANIGRKVELQCCPEQAGYSTVTAAHVEPTIAADKPLPTKRQLTLENAAKRRMVDILSSTRGACSGLAGLNVEWIKNQCERKELSAWSMAIAGIENELRAFRLALQGENVGVASPPTIHTVR